MADDALRSTVQAQLQDWFGKMAADWKHLKTYHIKHALPDQTLECGGVNPTGLADSPVVNVTWCGDWLDTASIDGALRSGRLAGEAIIQKLG
jgi:predicted NAD/FAD-dependent oxidoreductase